MTSQMIIPPIKTNKKQPKDKNLSAIMKDVDSLCRMPRTKLSNRKWVGKCNQIIKSLDTMQRLCAETSRSLRESLRLEFPVDMSKYNKIIRTPRVTDEFISENYFNDTDLFHISDLELDIMNEEILYEFIDNPDDYYTNFNIHNNLEENESQNK